MKVIDITGLISNRMWDMEGLFPKTELVDRAGICEGFGEYHFTEIQGMHTQVGTYLETNAHVLNEGDEGRFCVDEVPLDRIVNVDCVVLKVPKPVEDLAQKHVITLDDLQAASKAVGGIQPGDAVLVYTGWGDMHWENPEVFFAKSPCFTYEAMQWLVAHNPSIIGSDTSSWKDLDDNAPEHDDFLDAFYRTGKLMLAPLCNLNEVSKPRVKLTVLPIRIENVAAAPARAIIIED